MSEDEIHVREHTRRKPAKPTIVDAKKAKADAISDPQKRATDVTIVGAHDMTKKGVTIVSQHKPAK